MKVWYDVKMTIHRSFSGLFCKEMQAWCGKNRPWICRWGTTGAVHDMHVGREEPGPVARAAHTSCVAQALEISCLPKFKCMGVLPKLRVRQNARLTGTLMRCLLCCTKLLWWRGSWRQQSLFTSQSSSTLSQLKSSWNELSSKKDLQSLVSKEVSWDGLDMHTEILPHPTGRTPWVRPKIHWKKYISDPAWEHPWIPQKVQEDVAGEIDVRSTLIYYDCIDTN